MRKLIFSLLASIAAVALTQSAFAQTQMSGHGFTDPGTFRITVSGPGDLEVSQDLQSWSKFASVTQPTGVEDLAARQTDRRFYRLHGSQNVVGYTKVAVSPG